MKKKHQGHQETYRDMCLLLFIVYHAFHFVLLATVPPTTAVMRFTSELARDMHMHHGNQRLSLLQVAPLSPCAPGFSEVSFIMSSENV